MTGVALALAAMVLFLAYRSDNDQERGTRERATRLQQLQADIAIAETSVRGYVLTRRSDFRAAHLDAVARSQETLRELTAAGEDVAREAPRRVAETLEDWRANFTEPVIALVMGGRIPDAVAMVRTGAGARRTASMGRSIAAETARLDLLVDAQRRRTDRAFYLFISIVLGAAAFGVGAAILLRRRLQSRVVTPLAELTRSAERLRAGDFSARMNAAPELQEIALVAETFNRMAGEVERTVEELRELDTLKSTFVSTVSHELRTPLTSIIGYLDVLVSGEAGPLSEEQAEYAEIVQRNARRLYALIDDLLLLARMESGKLQLQLEEVELGAVVHQTLHDLAPLAQDKGVTLEGLDAPTMTVRGDRVRLAQALANLCNNAVKFTPAGGRVGVNVTRDADAVRIEVTDTGVGIPTGELRHITERFFRASTAGTIQGTGLGLSISREIVERHGGTVEIESVEGQGSTFRLLLPDGGPVE